MPNALSPTSAGSIFALVRDGQAQSRADLARITGLAPSTITLRVDELIRNGYLAEIEGGVSNGGRRPRRLSVPRDGRVVGGVDLGTQHANLVLEDLGGAEVASGRTTIDIRRPPEEVLRDIHRELLEMVATAGGGELVGIGLAVPGPVGTDGGRVISPSRMPGWNGLDPAAVLSEIAGVHVRTENDANALAVGEFVANGRQDRHMIVVKAGSSIGSGIIADGRLYRGARGMAGDVSHTAVSEAPHVICSCGRVGCLDAVAGGKAIVTALAASGMPVRDVADVAALARDANPLATRLLREAGIRVGSVLATLVGFFNPDRVVLAGALSSVDVFVAGVRSSVYELCLPLSTNHLVLGESTAGWAVGAHGVASLVREDVLDASAVDAALRDGRPLNSILET
jgi:predicted NBD/HSP70 family sugar kinase